MHKEQLALRFRVSVSVLVRVIYGKLVSVGAFHTIFINCHLVEQK